MAVGLGAFTAVDRLSLGRCLSSRRLPNRLAHAEVTDDDLLTHLFKHYYNQTPEQTQ